MDFHWCPIISGHLDFIPSKIQETLNHLFPDGHRFNLRMLLHLFVFQVNQIPSTYFSQSISNIALYIPKCRPNDAYMSIN